MIDRRSNSSVGYVFISVCLLILLLTSTLQSVKEIVRLKRVTVNHFLPWFLWNLSLWKKRNGVNRSAMTAIPLTAVDVAVVDLAHN